jgi:hypothetical protein
MNPGFTTYNMPLLFVHECHNTILKGSLVSKANTFPRYRMYDYHGSPVLKEEKSGTAIYGELWFVHNFDDLDRFESNIYKRELIFLENPCVFAYAYLFNQSVEGLLEHGHQIN